MTRLNARLSLSSPCILSVLPVEGQDKVGHGAVALSSVHSDKRQTKKVRGFYRGDADKGLIVTLQARPLSKGVKLDAFRYEKKKFTESGFDVYI